MLRFLIRRVLSGALVLWIVTTGVFVTRLAHGGFGYSYQNRGPVSAMIVDGLPVSLSVAAGAAVLWAVGGLAFGMLCAAQARTVLDRGVTSTMMAAVPTPSRCSDCRAWGS